MTLRDDITASTEVSRKDSIEKMNKENEFYSLDTIVVRRLIRKLSTLLA